MHTLLGVCKGEQEVGVPSGYFRNGWNFFLPMGTHSLLLSIVNLILCGLNEKEIVEKIIQESQDLCYAPFDFQFPLRFSCQEHKNAFFTVLERETRVSGILERTGVGYPKCIRQAMDLLLYIGILLRVGRNDVLCLDAIIEPYPFPEEVLRLSPTEQYYARAMRSRK